METFTGPPEISDYLEEYGLETLRYATPVVLVALDWGQGDLMARDLLGYLETFWTNRGVTTLFKDVIGRHRPPLYRADPDADPKMYEELDEDPGNHESFPSGHASGSFAFASYLERAVAREIGLRSRWRIASFAGLYGIAGYIAWSRVENDKHFFTDIVAGAAQGVAISRLYYRLNHPSEFAPRRAERGSRLPFEIAIHPPAPLPGGGLAFGLTFRPRDSSR